MGPEEGELRVARQSVVLEGMGWGPAGMGWGPEGTGWDSPGGNSGDGDAVSHPPREQGWESSIIPPGRGFLSREPIAQQRPGLGGKTEGVWWSWNLFRMTPT